MSDLRSGDRLGGFSILRKLGAGGMGVVYLARDETLDPELAVNLLGPVDPTLLEEARLAAALEHPAIVPVYAAGEDDGRLYLAMRYVPGGTLQQRLVAGPLDPSVAVGVLAAVADALDTAHRAGLVHRDVKPANILLDGDRAQLADFGLARRATSVAASVQVGIVPGTIGYVAPEQIEGDAFDGRADQYALACVAFECLTGRQPFARGSDVATIYAHLSDPPPRASALQPLPASVDDALTRGLAKRAADRFESCAALVTALGTALDGRVEGVPGPGTAAPPVAGAVADADDGPERAAEVRRKLVTVVVCDLSHSIAFTEGGDAESQRTIARGCYAEIRTAVSAHG